MRQAAFHPVKLLRGEDVHFRCLETDAPKQRVHDSIKKAGTQLGKSSTACQQVSSVQTRTPCCPIELLIDIANKCL
jgi:hypothetical protein